MIRFIYFAFLGFIFLVLSSFNTTTEIYLQTEQKVIHDLCFTKNGSTLLVADGANIRWFSTDTYKSIGLSSNGHQQQLLTIALSADSSLLVSGGKDSTVVLWN